MRHLNELQLDALREVGGIGAGHAATALSQLVDRRIALEVPRVEVVPVTEVPSMFGGPERLVVGAYAHLLGELSGGILFITGREAALAIVDLLHGREPGTSVSLHHEDEAMLRHAVSILVSAYVAAIGRMAGVDLLPSATDMATDMAGALLQAAVTDLAVEVDDALLVRTAFVDEGHAIEAALFFLPDPDSLSVILGRIGAA